MDEKKCVRCGELGKDYWTKTNTCTDCLKKYNKQWRSKKMTWCHPDNWKHPNGWWVCSINYYEQRMKKRNK